MADDTETPKKLIHSVEAIYLHDPSSPPTAPEESPREPANEPHQPSRDSRARGMLKVFLSYAPGVGKTQAMLKDALRRLEEGTDVVVGFVEVHGDMQVLQLLDKFEIFPQFIISGGGFSYQGMNLNKILSRAPQLVLVDHLAQSNPPGLRHDKRYLEVEELLDAGIDVYTTLNIYQLDSQADTFYHLTGLNIRETVSDQFMEEAEQLEMVDLPPQELIQRYKLGHVYVPGKAAEKYEALFQPKHLFGLRELALRYVARRSNSLMQNFLQGRSRARSKNEDNQLLVCVDAAPESAGLVRAGKRMADEIGADWTVVYVETPASVSQVEARQSIVAQHMRLAEMLGARTESLSGRSIAEVVVHFARKNHIHQVLVGRSARRRWFNSWLGMSLAEQLQREDPRLDIFVAGSNLMPQAFRQPRLWVWISQMQVFLSLVLVAIPTIAGLLLTPTIISRSANVVMLYLVSVVVASIVLGLLPAILTALLSVLVYDYFFIPPIYRLFGFAPENAITIFSLLVVSVITSTLVARERALTRSAQSRADQVTQLYDLSRDLAAAVDMPDVLRTIVEHVRRIFARDAVIFLPVDMKLVLRASSGEKQLDTSEMTAAEWTFQQGRPAGHNTGTFSYANFRYFPLETSRGIIGVFGVRLAGIKPDLYPDQVRMLSVFVTKAASAVERALFAEEASQAEILRVTEKLQSALLNSISHDLRTPLASITGVLSSLRMEDDLIDEETRRELVETAYGEAERLNRLVGNLLDMSRLESGMLKVSSQPCDLQDVIGSALLALTSRLESHPVDIDLPPDLPLVALDYVLIQQVLINLLDNAVKYSPENGRIRIALQVEPEGLVAAVEDQGPGVPPEDLDRIFEKFYRVKRFENVVGTGLGLSICKGIIEVHGGKIWAENRQAGGLRMAFRLPAKSIFAGDQEPDSEALPEEMHT